MSAWTANGSGLVDGGDGLTQKFGQHVPAVLAQRQEQRLQATGMGQELLDEGESWRGTRDDPTLSPIRVLRPGSPEGIRQPTALRDTRPVSEALCSAAFRFINRAVTTCPQ